MEKAAVSVVCQQISDLIDELDPFAKSAWGVKHEVDLKVGVRLSLHGGGQIIITRTAGGRYEVKFGRNSKGGGFTVIGEKGGLTSKHLIPTIDALMDSKGKKAMVVFHGTPHDFEEFKLDHMGKGEGAQAFGWGLYFTDTEEVAQGYRDAISKDVFMTPSGTIWSPDSLKHLNVRSTARRNGEDLGATIERAEELLATANDQTRPMLESDIEVLRGLQDAGGIQKTPGLIYEVSIPDGPYLLWDAPFSQQPDAVKKALRYYADSDGWSVVGMGTNPTGQVIYRFLGTEVGGFSEGTSKVKVQGGQAASEFLRNAGVVGVKYLDGTSRSQGEGTYNYVLFNDRDAKVTKKGSKAPTARLLQRQAGQLVLWHGGNLDEAFDETMAHKKGRWEYGPGLYLTTHYDTAKKYAKGSRKLYRITIAQGRDAWDVNLEWESVVGFIKEHCIRSKQKDVTARLERLKKDTNGVKAAWFVASLANNEAIASSKSGIMRKFLVDSGVDYEIVDNAFGWGERMIVLYNMKKIIKKEVVRGSDKIDEFDLPTEFSKDEQAEPVQ